MFHILQQQTVQIYSTDGQGGGDGRWKGTSQANSSTSLGVIAVYQMQPKGEAELTLTPVSMHTLSNVADSPWCPFPWYHQSLCRSGYKRTPVRHSPNTGPGARGRSRRHSPIPDHPGRFNTSKTANQPKRQTYSQAGDGSFSDSESGGYFLRRNDLKSCYKKF